MAETETLLENLKRRRVLQIGGMYIAATWLAIELGDWVTERFNLPGNLTSYVFVAMLVMLPAVLLVAYGHGAPGRDRWTATEKLFVPLNVLLAAVLLWFMAPSFKAEAATEMLMIEDEMGSMQAFEVARQGFHEELVNFFWENDSGNPELDWLEYGLPIMLRFDLNRVSPTVTAVTPFESSFLQRGLRRQGFDDFRAVPRGLAIELARNRQSSALILGRFNEQEGRKTVSATLIDTANGETLGSIESEAESWTAAVDEVTTAVLALIAVEPADDRSDLPVEEHLTASLEALQRFINAQLAIERRNDYPTGIAELDAALVLDAAFAEARAELSLVQYLSGDTESAKASANLALRNNYRLSEASEFLLKANRYIYDSDYVRGSRVLEIWSEVQPNSTRAHKAVASLARIVGGAEGLAKADAAYDRLLELNPLDESVWLDKAELEQQRGDFARSASHLQRYLELVPDSGEAYLQLARVYQAEGKLDAAQDALEDGAILSDDPAESERGLAQLEARRGRFDAALARLEALETVDLDDEQRVAVLLTNVEILMAIGRITDAAVFLSRASEAAEAVVPPAVRLVSIDQQQAVLLSLLGRHDEAVATLDGIIAQLQPPISSYASLYYTGLYEAAGNDEKFREWAERNAALDNELPDVFAPLVMVDTARLAIRDGNPESGRQQLDEARELFGGSILQVSMQSLASSDLYIELAKAYLEAGATESAVDVLENVLLVYPASPLAKLVLARAMVARDDEESARLLLKDALNAWADADDGYIFRQKAESLANELGGV